MEAEYFKPLKLGDGIFLKPYRYANYFGDTAFSMLYAWTQNLDYRYHLYENGIVVTRMKEAKRVFVFIGNEEGPSFVRTIEELGRYCVSQKIDLIFEDVGERSLDRYKMAGREMGKEVHISYEEKYSDYLYRIEDIISMKGSCNSTKRGNYNNLIRKFPDIRFEQCDKEHFHNCIDIFQSWCQKHSCEGCSKVYGCEYKAFQRILKLVGKGGCEIAMAYAGGEALSFLIYERINKDTISIYFQKNREKIRGLTYWLMREVALRSSEAVYLNLGEDMGLPGLMMDKSGFHPIAKLKKYAVEFYSELEYE